MAAKRTVVEPDHPDLSVSRQCQLLNLAHASYYRDPAAQSEENLMLMHLIDEEYNRHPSMGWRSGAPVLKAAGP